MATDPTQNIQRRVLASPFELTGDTLLSRVEGLTPSTDVPYLTVSVDWRVEGTSPGRAEPVEVMRSQDRSGEEEGIRWRPAVEILERELEDWIEKFGPHGEAYESLKQDKEKVTNYLQNELDPAAHGAFFVSNSAKGIFEASGFATPLPTETHVAPTPRLMTLVRLVEDNPTYGVLLADQHEAILTFLSKGRSRKTVTLSSTDYPRHQQSGGWSQARLQRRADERVEAFASDVAEEVRKSLDRTGVETLIVAGNEVMTTALDHEFHESVKERVAETIHLDIRANDDEVLEATQDIADKAERQRESDLVSTIRDQIGSDARGVGGPADTLRALAIGQVDELAMVDTFEGTGWADFGMDTYGVGDIPTEHPLGGNVDDIVQIDLPNEMIRLALDTGADVDIIHSDVPADAEEAVRDSETDIPVMPAAASLNEIGGVGAVLRYALDETAPSQSV